MTALLEETVVYWQEKYSGSLCDPKLQYSVHKNPQLGLVLSQLHPLQRFVSDVLQIHVFNYFRATDL
jgi:hypothetical protein